MCNTESRHCLGGRRTGTRQRPFWFTLLSNVLLEDKTQKDKNKFCHQSINCVGVCILEGVFRCEVTILFQQ